LEAFLLAAIAIGGFRAGFLAIVIQRVLSE
jgi:hypothetical protein